MNREKLKSRATGWLMTIVLLSLASTGWAKVIYVDDDAVAPGDGTSWATAYRYLRDALADATVPGEPVEIRVAQGTYVPDQSAADPEGTGDDYATFELIDTMSLLGGYSGVCGADANDRDIEEFEVVLSGDLIGDDAEVTDVTLLQSEATRRDNARVIVSITGDGVLLEGFTIVGATRSGVEVPAGAAHTMVRHCHFRGNRGNQVDFNASAGALTAYGEGLVVASCSFVGNTGSVGAVRADGQSLQDCLFTGNYGWGVGGGGVGRHYGGTFTDCVFEDNRARRSGGALYFNGGHSTLRRCIFRDNVAGTYGGALGCLHGNVRLSDCLFVGNRAETIGGACVHLSADAIAVNCLFVGNQAVDYGGGYVVREKGALNLVNCTVAGNRAPEAEFLWSDYYLDETESYVKLMNCVLVSEGSQIFSTGSRIVMTHTCLGEPVGFQIDTDEWLVLGEGNITVDPCLVDVGSWDDNGTADDPNDDVFVEGDYHLKSQAGRWDEESESWVQDDVTSPCIDAGDPNSPIMVEPFPNGGVINMGAYGGTAQASKSYFGEPLCETIIAGDINGDCRVDVADVILLLDHWLETGAKADE